MNTILKAVIGVALVGSLIGFSSLQNAAEPMRPAHDHDGDGKDDHAADSHEPAAAPAQAFDDGEGMKTAPTPPPIKGKTRMTKEGLKIEEVAVGSGKEATSGQKVSVHYRGKLTNGKQFDASYDRGQPFTFTLGAGEVIKGWDLGVAGMKEGGKRRLTIPSELGYGARGAGADIPPNATLVFDVELLQVG